MFSRNTTASILVFFCSSLLAAAPASAAEVDALAVMEKVQHRDAGEDFRALMEMVLVSASGKTKSRELLFLRKDYGDDSKLLLKFVAPKQLKNSGLLIHAFAEQDNLQWLYLSEAGKQEPRQIPAAKKDGAFLGSEFYYIDFEESQAKKFKHTFLRDESYNSHSTHVIESIPNDPDYPYNKLVSWVDKDTFIVLKVDCYVKDKLLKTIEVTKLEDVQGYATAMETVVTNHTNNKKSIMVLQKIEYNTNVPDGRFSTQELVKDL